MREATIPERVRSCNQELPINAEPRTPRALSYPALLRPVPFDDVMGTDAKPHELPDRNWFRHPSICHCVEVDASPGGQTERLYARMFILLHQHTKSVLLKKLQHDKGEAKILYEDSGNHRKR